MILAPLPDLTGMQFGRLLAIKRIRLFNGHGVHYVCSCACGNETTARAGALYHGHKRSCGCINQERLRWLQTRRAEQQRSRQSARCLSRGHQPENVKWGNQYTCRKCDNLRKGTPETLLKISIRHHFGTGQIPKQLEEFYLAYRTLRKEAIRNGSKNRARHENDSSRGNSETA